MISETNTSADDLAPASAAPDWSQIQRDILCPLCEYNLRGLIEPRCPECGHQFVWTDVVTQGDRTLPFLFEHRPDRNVWSLYKTFTATLRPGRFWRTLLPTHVLAIRRLVIFWLVLVVFTLPVAAAAVVWKAAELRGSIEAQRMGHAAAIQRAVAGNPFVAAKVRKLGSIQAVVDAEMPMPGVLELLRTVSIWDWRLRRYVLPCVGFSLLWPWLTLGALMVYRASLAQARIKTGHILRGVIYSQTPMLVVVPLAAVYLWFQGPTTRWSWWLSIVLPGTLWVLSGVILILTYRLAVAFRSYLRFPHAVASVVASQIIVGLALFKGYLHWMGF